MVGRRESWVMTYTGKKFYPFSPDPESIDILDIAHALSNTARFGGHTESFYSVAQHSVIVSSICPGHLKLEGLLHDAGEYIFGDLPKPIKLYMPAFARAEKNLAQAVFRKFGLCWPMPPEVRRADLVALATEKRDLRGDSPEELESLPDPIDHRVIPVDPVLAEQLFLREAEKLGLWWQWDAEEK